MLSGGSRRAGVVGDPVAHSLSPVLHRAAYQAIGLGGWSYDAARVPAGGLAAHLEGLGPEWVGLSVTRPGKEEAVSLAASAGDAASLTAAANTLVRGDQGWRADNTDVDGVTGALREAGWALSEAGPALIVGSGATARSALVALANHGVGEVMMQVRTGARPETLQLADRLGVVLRVVQEPGPWVPAVAVSAVPAGSDVPVSTGDWSGTVALDVVYDPWPTPWSQTLQARGARVVDGTVMLLYQAARQVELMTGCQAPVPVMRAALEERVRARRVCAIPGEDPRG